MSFEISNEVYEYMLELKQISFDVEVNIIEEVIWVIIVTSLDM